MSGYQKPGGRRWTAMRAQVFKHYGTICHLCGHGGANQVDHLLPVSSHPSAAWQLTNLRPVHGVPRNRCPVCNRACNQERQATPMGNYRKYTQQELKADQPRPDLLKLLPAGRRPEICGDRCRGTHKAGVPGRCW